jgi:hypothetical protein
MVSVFSASARPFQGSFLIIPWIELSLAPVIVKGSLLGAVYFAMIVENAVQGCPIQLESLGRRTWP